MSAQPNGVYPFQRTKKGEKAILAIKIKIIKVNG